MSLTTDERTLVLYMPEEFQGVGGIQMLIINIAQEMHSGSHPGTSLIVYCSKSSFVASQVVPLQGPRLSIRFWEDGVDRLPEKSLLLSWGGCRTPMRFRESDPHIVVWSVLPGQAFIQFQLAIKFFPFLRGLLEARRRAVITYLLNHGGLVAMDRSNVNGVSHFAGKQVFMPILPIGIPVRENLWMRHQSKHALRTKLSIAYIGRGAVTWKVTPFINLLADAILPNGGVDVTIYTDRTELYEHHINRRGLRSRPIEFKHRLNLSGEAMRKEMAETSDISFGMGLSLLEGGSVGVPSVYINPCHDADASTYWQWLSERYSRDFDLTKHPKSEPRRLDLKCLWNDRQSLIGQSERSFDYVRRHHSIASVVKALCAHNSEAKLSGYLKAQGSLIGILARGQRTRKNSPH